MYTPTFWKEKTALSTLLLPLGAVYGWAAKTHQARKNPRGVSAPVLSIGNAVAGGAGKTPVALYIGALLKAKDRNAHFLSRGYGGKLAGPVAVNAALHTVDEVGDEPLLLAQHLPTWVAKDKVAGAEAAVNAGADYIIMDDGFQNNAVRKDVSLLVIDGSYGFGNGRLIPAGPLREPVEDAMARATAIVLLGEDKHGALADVPAGKAILRAVVQPCASALSLSGKQVVAFAGIARPRKFYRTLQQMGCVIRKMVAYPDHHRFRPAELAFLREKAKEYDATLVTTAKDYVRLPEDMRSIVTVVAVEVVFADPDALLKVITP